MDLIRSILKIWPDKTIEKCNEVGLEDQHRIIYLRSLHLQCARVEFADFRHLTVIFDVQEAGEALALYNSGEPLPVDFRDVINAMNEWKGWLNNIRTIRDVTTAALKAPKTTLSAVPAPADTSGA